MRERFLWGVADSALQTEGGNSNSTWGQRPGRATESMKYFRADVEAAKQLGINSFRTSLSWSRLQPEPGQFNVGAIGHYRELVGALQEGGIDHLVITLHHFDEPDWFAQKGGWKKRGNIDYFVEYAAECVRLFGGQMAIVIPINEPNAWVANGYLFGRWPPYERNAVTAQTVYRNLIAAHNETAQVIRRIRPELKIASAVSMTDFRSTSPMGRPIAKLLRGIANFSYLDRILDNLDIIGIQVYFPDFVGRRPEWMARADIGWPEEITGEFLFNSLVATAKRYPDKPIIITEHGLQTQDDRKRQRALKLGALNLEMSPVRSMGYYHWSLMDNHEWSEPYQNAWPFGLYGVDLATGARTPKGSARVYGEIIKKNSR